MYNSFHEKKRFKYESAKQVKGVVKEEEGKKLNNSHSKKKWLIREIYNFSFDMKHANDFSLPYLFDDWSKTIIITITYY